MVADSVVGRRLRSPFTRGCWPHHLHAQRRAADQRRRDDGDRDGVGRQHRQRGAGARAVRCNARSTWRSRRVAVTDDSEPRRDGRAAGELHVPGQRRHANVDAGMQSGARRRHGRDRDEDVLPALGIMAQARPRRPAVGARARWLRRFRRARALLASAVAAAASRRCRRRHPRRPSRCPPLHGEGGALRRR